MFLCCCEHLALGRLAGKRGGGGGWRGRGGEVGGEEGGGLVYTEEVSQQSEIAATVEEDVTYTYIHSYFI